MRRLLALLLAAALPVTSLPAQDVSKYSEEGLRQTLAHEADARLGVMVPMRDGARLSTQIFSPKGARGPLPTILLKTPYDEHPLSASTLRWAVEAVGHGYAFIVQNERGRYFSDGKWEILGQPQTDGYDALTWIAAQPWSNGKVGTLGCSSSAEWQLALAAQNHPAHAAMVPMSAGAGIGTVGPFHEQGNWYTGGVPRTLFFVWLYGVDNPLRAQLPAGLDEKMQARIELNNDLAAHKPAVDWTKQIRHLPVSDLLSSLGEPPSTFDRFIARTPGDAAWEHGGLWQEGMGWGVPGFVVRHLVRRLDRAEPRSVQSRPRAQVGRGGERQPICRGRSGRPLPICEARAEHRRRRPRHGRYELRRRRHHFRLVRSLVEGRQGRVSGDDPAPSLLRDGRQSLALRSRMAAERNEDAAPVPA